MLRRDPRVVVQHLEGNRRGSGRIDPLLPEDGPGVGIGGHVDEGHDRDRAVGPGHAFAGDDHAVERGRCSEGPPGEPGAAGGDERHNQGQ
jgi:hypothetical protein